MAIFWPMPGKPYGPCRKPCRHSKCRQMRADAKATCDLCGKPIGWDTLFYRGDVTFGGARVGFRHFRCVQDVRSQERAAAVAQHNTDAADFRRRIGKGKK